MIIENEMKNLNSFKTYNFKNNYFKRLKPLQKMSMAERQKRTPNFYLGVLFLYDFFEFFVNK